MLVRCTLKVSFLTAIVWQQHKTRQSKNLHALWDGLLGPKWDEADVDRRAREMPKVELAAGGIEVWLKESRDAAVSTVYSPRSWNRCQWRCGQKARFWKSRFRRTTSKTLELCQAAAAEAAERLATFLAVKLR